MVTYIIEGIYLLLSIWAWVILAKPDTNAKCQEDAQGLIELLVDMIILIYMRGLRLLSIVMFIIICGPLLFACWWKNRPVPTENPVDLIKNLNSVKVSEFKTLRSMNYRHATPRASSSTSSVAPSLTIDNADMNGAQTITNPYEG